MQIEKKELFHTPLWEFDFNDTDSVLPKLLISDSFGFSEQLEQLKKKDPAVDLKKYAFTFLDFDGWGTNKLKQHINNAVQTVATNRNWPSELTYQVSGRLNVINPGELDTPHFHYSTLVGVYYIDVPEKAGDILFIDPRGYVDTLWEDQFLSTDPAGRSARCYHRITPKPNTLLLFPNYLIHSVENNLSDQPRLSVVINVRTDNPAYEKY